MLVWELVASVIHILFVSLSLILTTYLRMIPLMSIKGGEDQVKVRTVELIAMPDRDRGGAEGASE